MFSRILVPLDGSPLAESILPQVAELASRHGAELVLLRVALAHALPGTDETEAQLRVVREAEAHLDAVGHRLAADGIAHGTVVRYGQAADEILDHARTRGVDLIAMSTHGRTGIRRLMLGSVAETVLRGASVPVLLLRAREAPAAAGRTEPAAATAVPQAAEGLARPAAIRHILCPVECAPTAQAVMAYAGDLAQRFRADLTVLHATYDPVEAPTPSLAHPPLARLREEMVRMAERTLQEEMGRTLAALPRARLAVVPGSPPKQIVRYARAHAADLIVMGTAGRSGVDHLIMGSTAEQVVRTAPCPVLSLRAAA